MSANDLKITVREAIEDDAEPLLEFYEAVGGESDFLSFGKGELSISPDDERKIISRIAKDSKRILLVALDGEKIVGSSSVSGSHSPRFSHKGEIAIMVKKDSWGKGVGSALMQRMIGFSEDAGIEVLSLEVRSDNERAINLYRKFGFERYGVFKNYFKLPSGYFDVDCMTRISENTTKGADKQ